MGKRGQSRREFIADLDKADMQAKSTCALQANGTSANCPLEESVGEESRGIGGIGRGIGSDSRRFGPGGGLRGVGNFTIWLLHKIETCISIEGPKNPFRSFPFSIKSPAFG